jgi:hypothetical protein
VARRFCVSQQATRTISMLQARVRSGERWKRRLMTCISSTSTVLVDLFDLSFTDRVSLAHPHKVSPARTRFFVVGHDLAPQHQVKPCQSTGDPLFQTDPLISGGHDIADQRLRPFEIHARRVSFF